MGFASGLLIARASAALTSSYVASTAIPVSSYRRCALFIKLTRNGSSSGNTCSIKIEFSPDEGTTYYQMGVLQDAALTAGSTMTGTIQTMEFSFNDEASGANNVVFDLDVLGCTHLRVSAKETGDTTNLPTLEILAYLRA